MKKFLFVVLALGLLALGCAGFGHHGMHGANCPMHKACSCGPDCKCPADGQGGCGCKMACAGCKDGKCPMHKACACGPDCKCAADGQGCCCRGNSPMSGQDNPGKS